MFCSKSYCYITMVSEGEESMISNMEFKSFIGLLLIVSIGFLMLILPFFGIIFWAVAISIIFSKLHDYILKLTNSPNFSALITLFVTIVIVVFPFLFMASEFLNQGLALYEGLTSGKVDINTYFEKIKTSFPIIQEYMTKFKIDPQGIQEKVAEAFIFISKFVGQQAVAIGTQTINIVAEIGLLLYVSFFALRDKKQIISLLHKALPLGDRREELLFQKISEVTKATVNGSLVVALVQGFLGGLIFWFLDVQAPILWGGVMTLLSLVPLIGAGLVWAPVAIYFFATGEIQSGIILVVFGVGVIGLVDNILRPILVGKDTRLPDYLVLLSTLGGFALFGMNGFIIGPLLAVLFITCWSIFMKEYNFETDRELSDEGLILEDSPQVVLVKNETNVVNITINEDDELANDIVEHMDRKK